MMFQTDTSGDGKRLELGPNFIHLRDETALVLYGCGMPVHKGSKIMNIVLLGAEIWQ